MQYRPLDANGDYTIGVPFLANSPQCVAQAIVTRLALWQGEWFLDVTDGTPWLQSILGRKQNPDAYIKQRILGTPGVTGLIEYQGTYVGATSAYSVSGLALTLYGPAPFETSITIGNTG